jgi:hypothetical protein
MPTLSRIAYRLAFAVGLALVGMYGLANFVQPVPREMVVTIPLDLHNSPIRTPDGSVTARSGGNRLDDPTRLPKILEASRLAH